MASHGLVYVTKDLRASEGKQTGMMHSFTTCSTQNTSSTMIIQVSWYLHLEFIGIHT